MAKNNGSSPNGSGQNGSGSNGPSQNGSYGAGSIQVLKGLEAVRKRPGMYIGSTGPRGLHHLVYEVVDNSIDEALAGYADRVAVTIHKDNSITVADNGRGIPVDVHPVEKLPGVELAMTVLHAGGKFDKNSYKVSGGLHGVGVSCVNALSESLQVWVKRDGKEHTMAFARGDTVQKLRVVRDVAKKDTGTKVWFKPDPEIFTESLVYSYETLQSRLRELSFLNKGVTIRLKDEREGEEREETFHAEGGLREMVQHLTGLGTKKALHQQVFPDAAGKWLFARGRFPQYVQRLPASERSIRIAASFNGKLTRSVATADGSPIGEIFFALA